MNDDLGLDADRLVVRPGDSRTDADRLSFFERYLHRLERRAGVQGLELIRGDACRISPLR